ncbi:MAG: alkaline phosphatase family protein [Alistipes sp.]|nr:alkaline phosphatase family protein [Alistipes sp.]
MRLYRVGMLAGAFGFCAGTLCAQATVKPKLVLEIVVSQMRADYLGRFQENLSENGFQTFMRQGVTFENARYNYMGTNTVSGLATLTTGTTPAGHGIISENWYNFTTGDSVNLISDPQVKGLECEEGDHRYSPLNLTAATLGDRLHESDPKSKVIAVAADPYSAVVAGGSTGQAYWLNPGMGTWVSSSYYFEMMPGWARKYNEGRFASTLLDRAWVPEKSFAAYKNSDTTVLSFMPAHTGFKRFFQGVLSVFKKEKDEKKQELTTLLYTPFGNVIVTDFAREALIQEELGKDNHTDLLTVCYDTPRWVTERFGPQSIEVEDMYYKLDQQLGELVGFVLAQFKPEEVIVVLTSDHGCSNTYREGQRMPGGVFNVEQFKMIMNGFLSAQYEPGNWIMGYADRQLYLNRPLIFKYGFDLSEVQSRAAVFALQFRGVAGALTASDMQSGYFGKGYGEKMQGSFYPKRSGDVTLNLMPGWIEERDHIVSLPGSLYEYDTHVPLMVLGHGLQADTVARDVEISSLAPTLARMMGIPMPDAATGKVLDELLNETK